MTTESPSPEETVIPAPTVPEGAVIGFSAGHLKSRVVRLLFLIVFSTILSAIFGAVIGEKTTFLYKDTLHLSASAVSLASLLTGIPYYLAPLMGSFSEMFPFLGWRRRGYYVAGTLVLAGCCFALALLPTYHFASIVLLLMLAGAGALWSAIVVGGVTVSLGNATGRYGQFQALSQFLPSVLAIAYTAHLGGYVAQHWSYARTFTVAGLLALATLPLVLLLEDSRVPRSSKAPVSSRAANSPHPSRAEIIHTLRSAAKSPGLWAVLGFFFYLNVTPWLGTAKTYYLTDALHLSKQFIGDLGRYGGTGSLVATVGFGIFARRISPRLLVWGSVIAATGMYSAQLYVHDAASARLGLVGIAFTGALYSAFLNTLAVRACPKGIEGTMFGLITATGNISYAISDQFGSLLYDLFGPSHHHSVAHGWQWANGCGLAFTLAALVFIPFMPAWTRSVRSIGALAEEEQRAVQAL